MADEKLVIGSEENNPPEISVPPGTNDPPTQGQSVIPGMENEPIPPPTSSEVVVDFEKINELCKQPLSAASRAAFPGQSRPY